MPVNVTDKMSVLLPKNRMNKWRVAVTYNLKYSVKAKVSADAPSDALAEYDSVDTIEAIKGALTAAGHEVVGLEADETLLDSIRQVAPDICFNIAEGIKGEARESHVPALLEMLGIPYTASKVLANAVSLNKAMTKRVWRDYGLPTAAFQVFYQGNEPLDPRLTFPLFVKPISEGTGKGINRNAITHNLAELQTQVRWVIETYHQPALVEDFLPGREFTVGLIGNRYRPTARPVNPLYNEQGFHVLPIMEIDTTKGAVKGIFNAEAKSYLPDDEQAPGYLCPANIPLDLETKLKELTVMAFNALEALDVSRVDFRLGPDGQPYLVEINTLPGLNPKLSDICLCAKAENLPYDNLITEILNLAAERYGLKR